jgi:hypothetical protein
MARTPLTHPWTDQEIATLRVMLASGVSPRAAALKLKRKLNGVRRKISQIQAGDQATARQRSSRARKPDKPSAPTGASDGTF